MENMSVHMVTRYPSHAVCCLEVDSSPDAQQQSNDDSSQQLEQHRNCVRLTDFSEVNWKELLTVPLAYSQIINYPEARDWNHNMCAMCGRLHPTACFIPRQNKDICRECDTAIWQHQETGAIMKFCKGCKNFVQLADFGEKPTAAKCSKCRERGRANYVAKRRLDTETEPEPSTKIPHQVARDELARAALTRLQPKLQVDTRQDFPNERISNSFTPSLHSWTHIPGPTCQNPLDIFNHHPVVSGLESLHPMTSGLMTMTPCHVNKLTSMINTMSTPEQLSACRPSPRTVSVDFQFSPFSFQSPQAGRSLSTCPVADENTMPSNVMRHVSIDITEPARLLTSHITGMKRTSPFIAEPIKKRPTKLTNENNASAQANKAHTTTPSQLTIKDKSPSDWVDSNPLMQLANLIDVLSK